jgi:putative transposase
MFITKDGAYYRQFLPHYRSPGCIYHCRLSLSPADSQLWLSADWMFSAIEDAILADHKKECMIYAYVIMANHSHVVVQPIPKVHEPFAWCDYRSFNRLESIIGKIKGRSARFINQRIGRSGSLWQGEPYDRTIRSMEDLSNTIDYSHNNPIRWKLVESPEQYRWSSLRTIYSGDEKYRGWFDLPYVLNQSI